MQIIVEGNSNISNFLGRQDFKEIQYRLMRYILRQECVDGVLLYNVITGRLLYLTKNESFILDNLSTDSSQLKKTLVEDYYLVPVDFDEKTMLAELRNINKQVFCKKGISHYVIFTTTNCNARCYYCFESELPHINLNKQIADRIIEYIILNKDQEPIKISWFGGEPLLGRFWIDYICEELKKHNVKYYSAMTSNGYLFDKEMIEKAIDLWNLKSVQITLDGTEEVYNRTKSYVYAAGNPYRRVLKNIKLLLGRGIRVALRLNLDQSNTENIVRLIDELNTLFHNENLLHIYISVILKDFGFAPIARSLDSEKELYDIYDQLTKQLCDLGLNKDYRQLPSLRLSNCMADDDGAIAIFPDGSLYKCETIEGIIIVGTL